MHAIAGTQIQHVFRLHHAYDYRYTSSRLSSPGRACSLAVAYFATSVALYTPEDIIRPTLSIQIQIQPPVGVRSIAISVRTSVCFFRMSVCPLTVKFEHVVFRYVSG